MGLDFKRTVFLAVFFTSKISYGADLQGDACFAADQGYCYDNVTSPLRVIEFKGFEHHEVMTSAVMKGLCEFASSNQMTGFLNQIYCSLEDSFARLLLERSDNCGQGTKGLTLTLRALKPRLLSGFPEDVSGVWDEFAQEFYAHAPRPDDTSECDKMSDGTVAALIVGITGGCIVVFVCWIQREKIKTWVQRNAFSCRQHIGPCCERAGAVIRRAASCLRVNGRLVLAYLIVGGANCCAGLKDGVIFLGKKSSQCCAAFCNSLISVFNRGYEEVPEDEENPPVHGVRLEELEQGAE